MKSIYQNVRNNVMNQYRYIVSTSIVCGLASILPYVSLASTNEYIQSLMDQKQVEVIQGDSWETDYPIRAQPDPEYQKTDLAYWVNEVLPYEQDRNHPAYIVYPKVGIVAPVQVLTESDKQSILARKGFNHFPYLEQGVLHYVGYSPMQDVGNMVIAGHSAYFNSDPGRYKTIFQGVILTDPGDRIRYFEKASDGSYTRYEYQVTDSKETQTSDVSILFPTKDIRQITTYTCYPIGTSKDRRYNKGDLIGIQGGFSIAAATPAAQEEIVLVEPMEEADAIHSAAPTQEIPPKILRKTREEYLQSKQETNTNESESIVYNAIAIATTAATSTYYYTSF